MNALNKTPIISKDTYGESSIEVDFVDQDGRWHRFRRSGVTAPHYPDHPCYVDELFNPDGKCYVLDSGYLYLTREWYAEQERDE